MTLLSNVKKIARFFFQIIISFKEYLNFSNARPFEKEGFAFIPAKNWGGGRRKPDPQVPTALPLCGY